MSSSGEGQPLIEMADIMKRQLGLEGNIASVVQQAAEQLGIDAKGRPLNQLAAECMAVIGQ